MAIDRDSWVAPAPFRAHVRSLMSETGLPSPVIALEAGISLPCMQALLHDTRPRRRIPGRVAARLLRLDADSLLAAWYAIEPRPRAPELVRALEARGICRRELARRCRVPISLIDAIARGSHGVPRLLWWHLVAVAVARGLAHEDEEAA